MTSKHNKKIGIVSSFKDTCGNAAYADCLSKEFSNYGQVVNLCLPNILLQNASKLGTKAGDQYIDGLCNQIKELDYLNIQFEKGLYGTNDGQILLRIEKLIKSSSNCIVTLHRVDIDQISYKLSMKLYHALKYLLKGKVKTAIKTLIYSHSTFYKNLFKLLSNNNVSVIVHTEKEATIVKHYYGFEKCYSFPITFLTRAQRSQIIKNKLDQRNLFFQKWQLPPSTKVLSIFGFIAPYKKYETVINALAHLPPEYKLFIFGGHHPYSITRTPQGDPYIRKLCALVQKNKLADRVIFIGETSDDQMYSAITFSDIVVLPYSETGQGMSGVASLTLELKTQAFFSKNLAFLELKKLCPNGFEMFDIDNHLELSTKILTYENVYSNPLDEYYEKYNITKNIQFHLNIFKDQEASK